MVRDQIDTIEKLETKLIYSVHVKNKNQIHSLPFILIIFLILLYYYYQDCIQ